MTWLPVNLSTEARQNCCSFLSVVFFVKILVGLVFVFVGLYVQQSIASFGHVIYERYGSGYTNFTIAVGVIVIAAHLFGTKVIIINAALASLTTSAVGLYRHASRMAMGACRKYYFWAHSMGP